MGLFDQSLQVLTKSMDMYLLRHSVTADNIANAETPGFKARKVDFEDALSKAVETNEMGMDIDESALRGVQAKIYENAESEVGQDLNTVDMDKEMADMTKNETKYSATTQTIQKKFSILKYAIMGEGSN
jgi:flagellar basal-body rod protein FlgB